MQIFLGQILVAQLQKLGIYSDDHQRIESQTYKALDVIEKDLKEDDHIEFPNGTTLKVVFKMEDE
jgi:hypothetical protein